MERGAREGWTDGLEKHELHPNGPMFGSPTYLTGRVIAFSGCAALQADAGDIRAASTGLGTDDKLMSSIICGRTKPHLARVNMYYHSMYNMSLERQVKKETSGAYE